MNIVLYGFDERTVRPVAERFGFGMYGSFETFEMSGTDNRLLLLSPLRSGEEQLAFFERMADQDDRIDAVVAVSSPEDALSAVHYASQPGKFFTVGAGEEDPEAREYELSRIIETLSGRICAHEGIDPVHPAAGIPSPPAGETR